MFLRKLSIFAVLTASMFSAAQVREKETPQSRGQKVRDLLEKFNLAYQQKDTDTVTSFAAPDIVVFGGGNIFSGRDDFRDSFLAKAFAKPLPPSTWEIEKVVATPEMAWAYTKSIYKSRRQGQQIEADLYQLFVLQKSPKASNSADDLGWRIVALDFSFHREVLNPQAQPDDPGANPQ